MNTNSDNGSSMIGVYSCPFVVQNLTCLHPIWEFKDSSGITGYFSEDGHAWQAVGDPVTLEMGSNLLAGLAVTSGSRDESKLHTSTFDHVTVSNQVQMWHDFKPEVMDRELAAGVKYFGINTLRVYLHHIVFDTEKQVFLERIEAFLKICDRHGIKPGVVFFDDCWNHAGSTIDTPPPVDGRHDGRWAARAAASPSAISGCSCKRVSS